MHGDGAQSPGRFLCAGRGRRTGEPCFYLFNSKTAVSPYPCLENNGALCSQGNKGAALTSRRARDEDQEAEDSAQEEPATIAEVMSARHRPGKTQDRDGSRFVSSTKGMGWQTQTCCCLPTLQGCSPRVCIHQGAPTVCPNPTLSHKMPSFPHWLCVSFTKHIDARAYCCWAQPGAPLLLRVCDIQIINSFGHTLYFCCSL